MGFGVDIETQLPRLPPSLGPVNGGEKMVFDSVDIKIRKTLLSLPARSALLSYANYGFAWKWIPVIALGGLTTQEIGWVSTTRDTVVVFERPGELVATAPQASPPQASPKPPSQQTQAELTQRCQHILKGTAKEAELSELKQLINENVVNINSSMSGRDIFIGKSISGEYMLSKGTLGAFIRPEGMTISPMSLQLTLTLVNFF